MALLTVTGVQSHPRAIHLVEPLYAAKPVEHRMRLPICKDQAAFEKLFLEPHWILLEERDRPVCVPSQR